MGPPPTRAAGCRGSSIAVTTDSLPSSDHAKGAVPDSTARHHESALVRALGCACFAGPDDRRRGVFTPAGRKHGARRAPARPRNMSKLSTPLTAKVASPTPSSDPAKARCSCSRRAASTRTPTRTPSAHRRQCRLWADRDEACGLGRASHAIAQVLRDPGARPLSPGWLVEPGRDLQACGLREQEESSGSRAVGPKGAKRSDGRVVGSRNV